MARLRITPRTDRAGKKWRDDGYVIDEGTKLGGGGKKCGSSGAAK